MQNKAALSSYNVLHGPPCPAPAPAPCYPTSSPTTFSQSLHGSQMDLLHFPGTLPPQGLSICCSLYLERFPHILSWFTLSSPSSLDSKAISMRTSLTITFKWLPLFLLVVTPCPHPFLSFFQSTYHHLIYCITYWFILHIFFHMHMNVSSLRGSGFFITTLLR